MAATTTRRAASAARDGGDGRDSVGMYLDEIARTPLLDAAQEVELSKAIEAGLFAEQLLAEGRVGRRKGGAPKSATQAELEWLVADGRRAQQQFTTANLRLVVSIARKYGRNQMPMLDLIQEGNTGLIRAVEKFDYAKGYKFSTYATWWVRQAITRGVAQQARVVRLPVHVVEELNQIGSARRNLERQLGREPEPAELAAELDMSVERVLDLIAWGRDHVSLDTPVDEDGDTSLGDLVARETMPGPDSA
ncbi:MAG: sigma-70 family RNA polymerase sigma factor, partial [Actinomycetota bacterium]|nr:sigma-70 family RNA polymerase sigma factor [Actinomycetota bacterium]